MSIEMPVEKFPDGTIFGGVTEICKRHGEIFVQFVVISGHVSRVCPKCKNESESYANSKD
jgi:hypothetical protein